MQLRWEHIDERIARRVQSHITAPPSSSTETAPENRAQHCGQTATAQTGDAAPLEAVWSVFAASIAFFVVALYGTICFHLTGPLLTVGLLGLPAGIALASWLPSTFAARANAVPPAPSAMASAKPRAFRHGPSLRGKVGLPADRLRHAFTEAAQTRAESLYGEVVVSLMEPPHGAKKHGEKTVRFNKRRHETQSLRLLLDECNTLLDQSFRLQNESTRIGGLWKNGETLAQINGERFALLQKLDNETDPIVRQSLEESVSLCDERLVSVRAYPTLLARLDAHQEVVCQSLALVSSTLARQQATPHALHTPDVRGLRHALRTAAQETQAVEAAVMELTPHSDASRV